MSTRIREFTKTDSELNRKLVQLEDRFFGEIDALEERIDLSIAPPVLRAGYIARAGQLVRVLKPVELLLAKPEKDTRGQQLIVWNGSGGTVTLRPIGSTLNGLATGAVVCAVTLVHDGENWFSSEAVGPVSWQPGNQFPTKGKLSAIELVEHFTSVSAMRGLVASFSGVGAGVTDEDNDGSQRVGIVDCRTGTDTTGRAAVISYTAALRFGGGRHRLRWDARVVTLSDATDTFTTRIGFIDSPSAEPTDGAYFRYTHGANGGRWQAVTRVAGVETAADTGVAASAVWTYFEIEVNALGTSVAFYINGALVATSVANIPTGGNLTGIGVSHIKSAGTTLREFRVDLMAYSFEPTTLL